MERRVTHVCRRGFLKLQSAVLHGCLTFQEVRAYEFRDSDTREGAEQSNSIGIVPFPIHHWQRPLLLGLGRRHFSDIVLAWKDRASFCEEVSRRDRRLVHQLLGERVKTIRPLRPTDLLQLQSAILQCALAGWVGRL